MKRLRRLLSRPLVVIGVAVFLSVIGLFWAPVQRMLDIAALQKAFPGSYAIDIQYGDPPAGLGGFLNERAESLFNDAMKRMEDVGLPAPSSGWSTEEEERFRSIFRGAIEKIEISPAGKCQGDLGSVLKRFPRLRRFAMYNHEPNFLTEVQCEDLCRGARALPQLDEVALGSPTLTATAFALLAGHPQIRTVYLPIGQITPAFAQTLATLPRLEEITIGKNVWELEGSAHPREVDEALRGEVPRVLIDMW